MIQNIALIHRFNFPSVLDDGSRNEPAALETKLEALHDEFVHLRPLFNSAIDRSLLFLLQDRYISKTDTELPDAGALTHEWWSPHEHALARYQPGQAINLVRREATHA